MPIHRVHKPDLERVLRELEASGERIAHIYDDVGDVLVITEKKLATRQRRVAS